MLTHIPVLALCTALLGLLYCILTGLVVFRRAEAHISLKDGNDTILCRRIRAHANFNEYVPFMLIMLILVTFFQMNFVLFVLIAFGFTLGRYLHAMAFLSNNSKTHFRLRKLGMILTCLPMLLLVIYLLVKSLVYIA